MAPARRTGRMRVIETASDALLSPQGAGSFLREFDYTLNLYGG